MAKKKKLRKSYRKKANRTMRKVQAVSFMLMIALGFLLSWIFPLRPTQSESEKRELTAFPSFSFKTLWDGTFFDNISLWYSDTFPFREAMVGANSKIHSLYGFGNQVYGVSDAVMDEIPQEGDESDVPAADVFKQEDIQEGLGGRIAAGQGVVQDLGVIVIVDDAAYELYSFSKGIADKYAGVVNYTAQNVGAATNVYDIIVPTSVDITMPDAEREKVNSSNQADAIRYILSCMSDKVHSVNVYNTLRRHRSEYVYFRTDHHWTALGAYYAYEQFSKAAGRTPKKLDSFTPYVFEGFKGSFYTQTKKNAKLGANPDTVYAYDPVGDIQLTYTKKNGTPVDWDVITDVSTWASTSKYNTFIAGDNPYTFISNESGTGSCLVVKESFGNAFVPFLAADYGDVHVIDYRYWSGNLLKFIQENQIDDVIFMNNISAVRSATLVADLYSIVY